MIFPPSICNYIYYNTPMLDFICVLLIFFEIIFTVICVKKLVELENKVNDFHIKMLEYTKKILETIDEIKKIITKINKITKILTNKKLHQIKNLIMMTMDIIQLVILIKSLKLSKGLKSIDFKVIKNLMFAKATQEIIKKVLNGIQNLCV